MLRYFLLALGLTVLGLLVWNIGPDKIYEALTTTSTAHPPVLAVAPCSRNIPRR